MPELRRITARVTVRKGTAAQWQITNPTLLDGEMGWESDTSMLKVGDGTTKWKLLKYYDPGPTVDGSNRLEHDGTVFPITKVATMMDALEYSQKQINKWNQCARQDYINGYDGVSASCVSDGTI